MHGWGHKNKKLLLGLSMWISRILVYLLHQRPDVLWAADFWTAFPAALATRFSHVPFIYYIHDNISLSYDLPRWMRSILETLDSWVMKRAAAIIVPDENRILPHAEAFRAKFHILPNAPSGEMALPLKTTHSRPFTIYANGSLWDSRGIETLLLASDCIAGCRVLLAGRIPQPWVLDSIRSRPQVDLRGSVSQSEALDLYNESDVVFAFYDPRLPINVRASPMKLYEAMMMGKPVIVNEETMISSKVKEWDIGYVCGYHDVESLENLLRRIRSNLAKARLKGKRARGLFEVEFDWRLLEPRLWQIVGKVAGHTKTAQDGVNDEANLPKLQ